DLFRIDVAHPDQLTDPPVLECLANGDNLEGTELGHKLHDPLFLHQDRGFRHTRFHVREREDVPANKRLLGTLADHIPGHGQVILKAIERSLLQTDIVLGESLATFDGLPADRYLTVDLDFEEDGHRAAPLAI